MWLLLVEDEQRLAQSLCRGLTEEGYTVDVAFDGRQGYLMGSTNAYDLLIVDWRLPYKDGRTLVEQLRAEGHQMPIILLTALGDIDHKVAGLDAGADDYLTKPFSFEELLARIRAQSRRTQPLPTAGYLQAGLLEMHTTRRQVFLAGQELILRPKAYAFLEALLRQPARTLSRTVLAERVWGSLFPVRDNVIDVTVSGLRQQLADALRTAQQPPDRVQIQTVWGVGYRLVITSETGVDEETDG